MTGEDPLPRREDPAQRGDDSVPRREEDPLQRPVYAEGGNKPFGEFTLDDVRARAAELASATGWGPTARVGGVARAWSELARAMASAGAGRVCELDRDASEEFARRLWVVPPGGSLL